MSKVDFVQINPVHDFGIPDIAPLPEESTPKFSETLNSLIDQVDANSKAAMQSVEDIIAGKEGNLHEAMAALEEASLSFQLMLEIRNKLLESYQELMRMQI